MRRCGRSAGPAYQALEDITGLRLSRRAVLWKAWLVREQRWTASEREAAREVLAGADVAHVMAMPPTLAPHRLERQRLAYAIVPLLVHADARVRGAACHALGALWVRSAAEPLREALRDSEAAVTAAARSALVACTGGT